MKVEWKQQPNTHKTSCVTLLYGKTGRRFRLVDTALYYLCIKFPVNSSQIAGKSMSHNYIILLNYIFTLRYPWGFELTIEMRSAKVYTSISNISGKLLTIGMYL